LQEKIYSASTASQCRVSDLFENLDKNQLYI
jgi:hypothetical protein